MKLNRLGILLAGGNGTRLYPSTSVTSKQLVPVYDKPTAYYAMSTLINLGIDDVLIICRSADLEQYQKLFRTGSQLGITLNYATQDEPKGIADAFNVVKRAAYLQEYDQYVLILGDNIFCDSQEITYCENFWPSINFIFGVQVKDPTQYGVISKQRNKLIIEEKPQAPKSNIAVAGLYSFDHTVFDKVEKLKPSGRKELEITDLIRDYIKQDDITLYNLTYTTWFDTGTPDSLLDAANYIKSFQNRTGKMIGCIEEAALNKGLINKADLKIYISNLPKNYYSDYLKNLC